MGGEFGAGGGELVGGAVPGDHRAGRVLEQRLVLAGHPEQFTDDQGGHGQREGLDEIGRRARGLHAVEQAVDDLLYPGGQGGHPLDGETARQHPPLTRVLGVVLGDERLDLGGSLGLETRAGRGETGPGGVGAEAGVG
ncbi:hypothetical protein [Streptomyces sp. NPDC021356]|uniref:hypothetical protein n=1 Tax=Streptomyces sp. NPDC021356 TaxID=3154900 RepID=UPI003408F3D0